MERKRQDAIQIAVRVRESAARREEVGGMRIMKNGISYASGSYAHSAYSQQRSLSPSLCYSLLWLSSSSLELLRHLESVSTTQTQRHRDRDTEIETQ
jgi:hypothetical protein